MKTLHENSYDIAKATSSLVPSTGPVYCMDEMEQWSIGNTVIHCCDNFVVWCQFLYSFKYTIYISYKQDEARRFEEGIHKYGKDFLDLQHEFVSNF